MPDLLNFEITEFTYLNSRSNLSRYRYIMRCFYEQYQKMNYWLQPEEILQGVLDNGLHEAYDIEKLQVDLVQLVAWKSLTEQHDGSRVTTIEEYLKKRYRYMITPYAIEIERLVIQLEGVKGYGGSLQPSKLHELVRLVRRIRFWSGDDQGREAVEIWDSLMGIFKELNEQASDFIASLSSQKSQDLFSATAFLTFKDRLIHYLQDFIQVLQHTAPQIAHWLEQSKQDRLAAHQFLQQVVTGKVSTQFEDLTSEAEWTDQVNAQWDNLVRWFVLDDQELSNVARLELMTKDTIFRVLRAAVRLQEKGRHGNSRRQELEHIGRRFLDLRDNLEAAHHLAAYVFGLYETRHYYGEHDDGVGLHETRMWDTDPIEVLLPPRGHQSRQRNTALQPVISRKNKVRSIRDHLEQKMREDSFLLQFLERGMVNISDLGEVRTEERQQILLWIGRCLNNKDKRWTTTDGITIQLLGVPLRTRTVLRSEDGELQMPDFTLVFERKGYHERT